MERGREIKSKRKKERKRDSFGILYTGYILLLVKIKREREREIERERGKERGRERWKYHHKRQKQENVWQKLWHNKKVWPKVNRLISRDLQNTNLKFLISKSFKIFWYFYQNIFIAVLVLITKFNFHIYYSD